MAKFTTITKKKDEDDERTVNASEFINRLVSSQRKTDKQTFIPNTEQPK